MSRTLVIEPAAEAEIAEALDWYSQFGQGVLAAFQDALERALMHIRNNPLQYQCVHGEARRTLVGHYPYALIYEVTDGDILVIGCFHGRRDPSRWQERVRS